MGDLDPRVPGRIGFTANNAMALRERNRRDDTRVVTVAPDLFKISAQIATDKRLRLR